MKNHEMESVYTVYCISTDCWGFCKDWPIFWLEFLWTGALEDERVELDNKSYVASQSIYYIVERWDSMKCMVREMGREVDVFQQHTGKTQRVI